MRSRSVTEGTDALRTYLVQYIRVLSETSVLGILNARIVLLLLHLHHVVYLVIDELASARA